MLSAASRSLLACLPISLLLMGSFRTAEAGARHRFRALKEARVTLLHAGPIRVKFIDGELHYLMVGDKEIIRRIYFAVRDGAWNTTPPVFQHIAIHPKENGFSVDLDAVCRGGAVDYRWQGQIVGTPDGNLTFHAKGVAGSAFASNRISLCVLFGVGSLRGQGFETLGADGGVTPGAFPDLVSPTLVAAKFQTLRYTTNAGVQVITTLQGAQFDMEDQRNWGDTSYKAYAPLVYPYPQVVAGAAAEETVTVEVRNALTVRPVPKTPGRKPEIIPARVTIGAPLPEGKVPVVVMAAEGAMGGDFSGVNMSRDRFSGLKTLTWGLAPSVHLPDDDNLMDNVGAVLDQVRTARSFAPDAAIQISPIRLGVPGARNEGSFGAAWSAAALKYLSLAAVDQVAFRIGPGLPQAVQKAIGAEAGRSLYATTIEAPGPHPVEAFAVDEGGTPIVWLINLTAEPQPVEVAGLPDGVKRELRRYNDRSERGAHPITGAATPHESVFAVTLAPYEVCELRPAGPRG